MLLLLTGCIFGTSSPWDGTWIVRFELPGVQGDDCAPDDDDPVRRGDDPYRMDIYTLSNGEATLVEGSIILTGSYDNTTLNLEYEESEEDSGILRTTFELDATRDGKTMNGTLSSLYQSGDYLCTGAQDFSGSKLGDTNNHLD